MHINFLLAVEPQREIFEKASQQGFNYACLCGSLITREFYAIAFSWEKIRIPTARKYAFYDVFTSTWRLENEGKES